MKMFRKRFIPDEIVDISSDEVLERNENIIVTKWLPIKPREDIGGGISYVFLKKGYKISKIYDNQGKFKHWYCDIIEYTYNQEKDEYIFVDLLADVVIYPDGKYEVLDIDELKSVLEAKIITKEQMLQSIKSVNTLVEMVQNGVFPPEICDKYEFEGKKIKNLQIF